jgi:hypothetical protein
MMTLPQFLWLLVLMFILTLTPFLIVAGAL